MRNLLLIFLCLSLTACASHYGAAYITSNPPGAQIINTKDGTLLGVTPTTVWWKDGSGNRQQIPVRFQKDGYYEKTQGFWLSMRHRSIEKAKADPTHVEVNLQQKTGE